MAEETAREPRGCPGGSTCAKISPIWRGLPPPEPALRGQPLAAPISLCNNSSKNGSSPSPEGRATATSSLSLVIAPLFPQAKNQKRTRIHGDRCSKTPTPTQISLRQLTNATTMPPPRRRWSFRSAIPTAFAYLQGTPDFHSYFVTLLTISFQHNNAQEGAFVLVVPFCAPHLEEPHLLKTSNSCSSLGDVVLFRPHPCPRSVVVHHHPENEHCNCSFSEVLLARPGPTLNGIPGTLHSKTSIHACFRVFLHISADHHCCPSNAHHHNHKANCRGRKFAT